MSGMRSQWLSMLGAAVSAALYAPVVPAADAFAAGVLSCAAESDRDRRLECYDRAVAGYTAGLSNGTRNSAGGQSPGGTRAPAAAAAVGASSAVSGAAGTRVAGGGAAGAGSLATPSAAGESGTSIGGAATTAAGTGAATVRHVAARIVSIDHFPDYVVVHLDNQQIWKQVSDSPGGQVLRSGDSVTVDKQFGSYWLAGPKGEAVQVKLETAKP